MPADEESGGLVSRVLGLVGQTGRLGWQLAAAGPLRYVPEPARRVPAILLRLGVTGAITALATVERLRKGPTPAMPFEDVQEEAAQLAQLARQDVSSRQQEPQPAVAAPTPPATAVSADEPLPIPDFDHVTVASLRARLRQLDVAELDRLRDYEQVHAHRAAVLTMLDNRIAKLEEEAGDHQVYPAEAELAAAERAAGEDGGTVRP